MYAEFEYSLRECRKHEEGLIIKYTEIAKQCGVSR